ncbi:MAG: selenium-dependent molybdenum cofactor biosynthesis protein YqeB, partial [Chloroflexota bacterium]
IQVQDMVGCHIINMSDIESTLNDGCVPVVIDPDGQVIEEHSPLIVIDARMLKRATKDTDRSQASLVIALGPGFVAGANCHAVIETKRGHYLGRVILDGQAAADTGVPGSIDGMRHQRVLYAPVGGFLHSEFHIGDKVSRGQPVGYVGKQPVSATLDGVLRGLVHSSVSIKQGQKIGDIDPRGVREYCFTISDKALAIGGGVLEAIFSSTDLRTL